MYRACVACACGRRFEARQKELKEALRLERSRTSTMREQLDQVDVMRKQCMQLAMQVDREANEVRRLAEPTLTPLAAAAPPQLLTVAPHVGDGGVL